MCDKFAPNCTCMALARCWLFFYSSNADLRSIRLKPKQRRQLMQVIEKAREQQKQEEELLELEEKEIQEAEIEAAVEEAEIEEEQRDLDPAVVAQRDKVRSTHFFVLRWCACILFLTRHIGHVCADGRLVLQRC